MKFSSSIRFDSLIIPIFFIFFYDHRSASGSISGPEIAYPAICTGIREEAEIRRAMKRMNVEDDDNEGPLWPFGGESTDEASDGELDGLENDQLVSAVAWDNVKRSRWLRGAEWVGDSPVDVVRPRLDKKEAGGLKRSYTMRI